MSDVRLTADEREALSKMLWDTTLDELAEVVEAILAARLAPVEALAAEMLEVGADSQPRERPDGVLAVETPRRAGTRGPANREDAMTCRSCTAETSNGLALCERCRVAASVYLEFFPVYFRNLARWRPGRAGSRPVPGSREPQTFEPAATDRVSIALDAAGSALTTWARTLADDRGIEAPVVDGEAEQVAALCRWFSEHLTSIATLEWCGEFMRGSLVDECDGIGYHEAKLRSLTENLIPGWYAGACGRCESRTYVVPGLTWVTCGSCGVTTYARDHLETILDEARGWVAPPKRLAEAAVALLDTEQSVVRLHERIKKWGTRGKVTTVRRLDGDGDPVGMKRYHFGEVLDRLSIEGQTRTSVNIRPSSTEGATLVPIPLGGSVPTLRWVD